MVIVGSRAMSGEPVERSLGELIGDFSDWQGPVTYEDIAPACCAATIGADEPLPSQPCGILHGVLSPEECRTIIAFTEPYHQTEPTGTEMGERSQFVTLDPQFVRLLWQRVAPHVPAEVDGGTAIGLLPKVSHVKYFPGQVGFPHMDFRHGPGEQFYDECVSSRISFTVYLNDDFDGGELDFLAGVNAAGTGFNGAHHRFVPRVGSAAIFYQGVPQFAHHPLQIRTACKHIMRADIMYRFSSKEDADVGGARQ